MTTEFIFVANVVLLLRLRLLLADAPVRGRAWLGKGAVELAVLGLFEPHPFLVGAALTTVAFNAGAAYWERRASSRHGGRLLFGALQLAALSVWFSAAGGVQFRAELSEWARSLEAWSALGGEITRLAGRNGLRVVLGALLAANEANLLVRWILLRLQIRPGTGGLTTGIDASEFNRGRVIGLLERGLIYAFVLSGQYGAIGFTLAAKGFTRFKELENRGFAEYVLIGTLLSSTLALAAGWWVKFST
jgi:hypothetical protein